MAPHRRTTGSAGWLAALLTAVVVGSAAGQGVGMPEPVPVGRGGANPYFGTAQRPPIAMGGRSGEPAPRAAAQAPADDPPAGVVPAGCKSCGAPLGLPGGPTELLTGGCSLCNSGRGDCGAPGQDACHPCHADTRFGQLVCCLYECLCCPDPCYEPKWVPLADAAFFTPAARPVTHSRFRGSFVRRFGAPDRAEYFWARSDGRGRGPSPRGGAETRVNVKQLGIYNEGATGRIGVFTEVPYLAVSPTNVPHASGFGDLTVGTKTLLFDCELLQVAYQFATTIPVGNVRRGLGTGHVSLEPSVIIGLKLSADSYLQAQVAEWVPIGGDPAYQGSILHTHVSLNHVICRPLPDVPVIGVVEMGTMSFQDGAFTDPVRGSFQRAGDETYVTLGPGVRVSVCDRIDFGVGSAYLLGNRLGPQAEYRFEFRARY